MKTNQLFKEYNQALKNGLIPKGNEYIIGCFTDPNKEVFNVPLLGNLAEK